MTESSAMSPAPAPAVTLEFSRSLYAEDAVAEAVSAYGQLARFHVESSEHTVSVAIHSPHPKVPDLADHFANHVLFATVGLERRGELA